MADRVDVYCRTNQLFSPMAYRGRKRGGRSKGYRVMINTSVGVLSVYPADARKAAIQLLDLADECERG